MIGLDESHTPRDTGEKRKAERNGEVEQGLKKERMTEARDRRRQTKWGQE